MPSDWLVSAGSRSRDETPQQGGSHESLDPVRCLSSGAEWPVGMGFYLRKAIKVGPLRFNLSKSGVGVSAGVRGARIGTGPRGNYVHVGRHGAYYRATLPGGRSPSHSYAASQPLPEPESRLDTLEEIESGDVSAMRDSSSADLLEEFKRKQRLWRIAPAVLGSGGVAIAVALATGTPTGVWVGLGVLTAAGGLFAHLQDLMRKTVVLLYELEPEAEVRFQALHDGFSALAGCSSIWHVEAAGEIRDWKRSAGATEAISRKSIRASNKLPPFVRANISVPALPVGRQTLFFFPDRLLVVDSGAVGAVPYNQLSVERNPVHFVETGSLPGDAKVIDKTWRYVNKKGGPDRRFKDNPEIPITLYDDVHLKSPSGLNELVQLSKPDGGETFAAALAKLGDAS